MAFKLPPLFGEDNDIPLFMEDRWPTLAVGSCEISHSSPAATGGSGDAGGDRKKATFPENFRTIESTIMVWLRTPLVLSGSSAAMDGVSCVVDSWAWETGTIILEEP